MRLTMLQQILSFTCSSISSSSATQHTNTPPPSSLLQLNANKIKLSMHPVCQLRHSDLCFDETWGSSLPRPGSFMDNFNMILFFHWSVSGQPHICTSLPGVAASMFKAHKICSIVAHLIKAYNCMQGLHAPNLNWEWNAGSYSGSLATFLP